MESVDPFSTLFYKSVSSKFIFTSTIAVYFFQCCRKWERLCVAQQDSATCHTANVAIYLLKNRIISSNGEINLLASSCDLNLLDYFLLKTVKDKCYTNYPEMIHDLSHENEVTIAASLLSKMCWKIGSTELATSGSATAAIWMKWYSIINSNVDIL